MAKRETKQTYGDIRDDRVNSQGQYSDASANAGQISSNIAPFIAQGREQLSAGYNGLGAPAQISTQRLGNVYDKYGEIADTGGFSEGTRSSILENVGGLKGIGASGGYDAESIARARGLGGFENLQNEGGLSQGVQNRMRGNGGYDEFAATGGLSSIDRANIKAKAISPISSFATGAQDEMNRRRSLQGGYGPGFDAANRALSRDTSRAIADTSLNAELGIMDRVNQGRLAGISGVSGSESNLQGLRTGNMLNATQGIASAEQSMVANRTGNQLRGLESASQIESDLSSRIAQLRLQGMNGQQASATAMAEIEGRNVDNNFRGNIAGLSGASDLYKTDIAQQQAERERQLALMGQGTQANLGYYNPQTQLAMQPGTGSNIMKGIGTAAGIAAMAYTGGASSLIGKAAGGGGATASPQVMPTQQGIGGIDPRLRYYGF